MSDREPPDAAAAHKVVDTLLPWLANGTLEGDERAFVESHLRDCAQCRGELEWLRGLKAACAEASASPDGERATRKLRAALDVPPPRRGALRRWQPWVGAIAAAALIAIGAAWIAPPSSQLYRTLGARDGAPAASAAIVVVFDPATTEFELRRILRAAGARIVDGPTRTNAYVLDVPPAQRPQALATLRAEHAVMLAERLDGGTPR